MKAVPKALIFFFILLFGIQSGLSLAASEKSPESAQDRIKAIESELSREKRKLKAVDSQEKDILAQLTLLEQEVSLGKRAVKRINEKIHLARAEIRKLKGKLRVHEASFERVEAQVDRRLVAFYKHARKGYLRVLADATDLDQFYRLTKYLKAVMDKDRREMEQLSRQARGYRNRISKTKSSIVEKEAVNREENGRLAALSADLEKKVIQLMKIHKEKEFYETAVEELQLAAKNLKKTLMDIERRADSKSLKAARFADYRGRLPLPVEGKVIRAGKLMRSARAGSNKGVFVEGDPGAKVRSVFGGRVDFSGKIKGYGEVVIINHGARYFTISARLLKRTREEGEMIKAGEVIGLAGVDQVSKRSRLYFEIRKGERSLDPIKWLKAR